MKMIPWLEEKLPEIAHQFVNLLFVLACFSLFNSLAHAYGKHAPDPIWLAVGCLWILIWIGCLKLLPSFVARICLGISTGVFSVILAGLLVQSFWYCLHNSRLSFLGVPLVLLFVGTPLAGFSSMFWLALRPSPCVRFPANPRGLVFFSNYSSINADL